MKFIFILVIEHLPSELRDRFFDMREMDLSVQSKCTLWKPPYGPVTIFIALFFEQDIVLDFFQLKSTQLYVDEKNTTCPSKTTFILKLFFNKPPIVNIK